jgi:hypothetical protein
MCWTLQNSAGTPRRAVWNTSSTPQSRHFLALAVLTILMGTSRLPLCRIDVLQLIEEAVEGSWIGHRARMFTQQQESEIGSLYAPPRQDGGSKKLVEVVIEIGDREEVSNRKGVTSRTISLFRSAHRLLIIQGWLLKLEKGGIRRVLMNVFGNSLKFTTVCFSARRSPLSTV